ncbi:hypothetical protein LCGC14_0581760 [marine sediment metagenome]|uniref:Uncharacterized protein n=1 Tax=marine sediment metagenome TaxID=412755 RepID=A0A0F9U2E1_9ZZZZ
MAIGLPTIEEELNSLKVRLDQLRPTGLQENFYIGGVHRGRIKLWDTLTDGSAFANDVLAISLKSSATASFSHVLGLNAAGRLELPTAGSSAGILAGGDTLWYRSAADTWRTPDSVIIDAALTVTTTFTPPDESILSRYLAPVIIHEACTGDVTINSTTDTDITGCTTTFTPAIASVALVVGMYDIDGTHEGEIFAGDLDVDGTDESSSMIYEVATAGNDRKTMPMVWLVALTAAEHTLKLQARRVVGANTATVRATHTKLVVLLLGDANATIS